MHEGLLKKKPKLIVLFTCAPNINGVRFDTATFTLSHLYGKSPIVLFSTLVRSDLLLSDHKKTDDKLISEFLWWNICCYMSIKDFLLK